MRGQTSVPILLVGRLKAVPSNVGDSELKLPGTRILPVSMTLRLGVKKQDSIGDMIEVCNSNGIGWHFLWFHFTIMIFTTHDAGETIGPDKN